MTMPFYKTSNERIMDGPLASQGWIPIHLGAVREITSGSPLNIAGNGGLLATDTTPILNAVNGDTDGAWRMQWASSNSDAIGFSTPIPPDLDLSQPIYIKFLASMGGATDIPIIDADTFFGLADTKVEDASAAVTGTTIAEYSIEIAAVDIEKIGSKRFMAVELTPAAHTTDVLNIFSLYLTYSKV